jgi:hypothetical protein
MKKFKIICNSGSLSASGGRGSNIEIEIEAENKIQAEEKFNDDMENKIYGRKIFLIEEKI